MQYSPADATHMNVIVSQSRPITNDELPLIVCHPVVWIVKSLAPDLLIVTILSLCISDQSSNVYVWGHDDVSITSNTTLLTDKCSLDIIGLCY